MEEIIKKRGMHEYYTPHALVNDIINSLPEKVWVDGKTFIDPECGNGRLLVAIVQRKLELQHTSVLETIFGTDIMEDSVQECRNRLLEICGNTEQNKRTVMNNIRCKNTLTYNYEFEQRLLMPNPYHPRIQKNEKFAGYGWFYVPSWNLSIGAPAKAGSSSLKHYMTVNDVECKYTLQNQIPKKSDIYFVVRNPYQRFVSLWKSKCRDKRAIADTDVHGLSPRALMAHISSGKKDVHWTPQANLIRGLQNVNLIPLEKLNDWWWDRGYGTLEVVNPTDGSVELCETICDWMRDFYAEDFILYAQCCDNQLSHEDLAEVS